MSESKGRVSASDADDSYLLSVVIPVWNEASTLSAVVERLRATRLPLEIIVVDDGSTDATPEVLRKLAREVGLTVITHGSNRGKGAALKSGLSRARGDFVVVQDADLEYDPADLPALLQPVLEDRADVVYGSRYGTSEDRRADGWHFLVNGLITLCSNLRTGWRLSDVETCYKLCRRELIQPMVPQLRERGFGIELELTARLARVPGVRMVEVPISYRARSYAEGKKITWRDGFRALWCVWRY